MTQFDCSNVNSLPSQSIRVICTYNGENVTLVYQAIVNAVAWNFHPINNRTGYFLDSYDVANNLLSRQFLYNAFTTQTEVHSPTAQMTWIPQTMAGTFTALVPFTDNTDHIRVVNVAFDPPFDPAITPPLFNPPTIEREIARFPTD